MAQQQTWATVDSVPPNCPPGLEYLVQVDQLNIQQETSLLEMFSGMEVANTYKVLNGQMQQCYHAVENSSFLCRQFVKASREFNMQLLDNAGNKVANFSRPFKCYFGSCCDNAICQLNEIDNSAGGQIISKVRECKTGCCQNLTMFGICDADGNEQLRIVGTPCSCSMSRVFTIQTMDGQEIGQLQKHKAGLFREMMTDSDNFSITFPIDLDVKIKAGLLSAVFLIDFMFFEKK